MASLKEVKGRIASVKSTQKITSAMKMVASAKLRKAQYQIENFLPYEIHLQNILNDFLSSDLDFTSSLAEKRDINAVAIVVFSSNSSLCGAFNSNVAKLFNDVMDKYKHLPADKINVYPVGKKIEDTLKRLNVPVQGSYIELMNKPNFNGARDIADLLIANFLTKKIDKVEIIYNHFKNTAIQIPTNDPFLPIQFHYATTKDTAFTDNSRLNENDDYIVEPDKETVVSSLIPKALRSKIYAVLLDSAAAEQAARTMAMQIATDNAQDLLEELTIQYNKQRQQAITSELLDIISGSEALK